MARPRIRLKLKHLMILVAVVAVGLCLYCSWGPRSVSHWVGGFDLEVALDDRSGRSVVGVFADAARVAEAENFLVHPESNDLQLEKIHWVPGRAFKVWIRAVGSSTEGRELSYHQHEVLVIRIDYADGTNRLVSARIPDGRRCRRVAVVVD